MGGLATTFVGASLQLASTNVQVFFAGKVINGVALGFLLTTVLTWLSEVPGSAFPHLTLLLTRPRCLRLPSEV